MPQAAALKSASNRKYLCCGIAAHRQGGWARNDDNVRRVVPAITRCPRLIRFSAGLTILLLVRPLAPGECGPKQLNLHGLDLWVIGMRSAISSGNDSF